MSREDAAGEEGMMKDTDLRQRKIPEETERHVIKGPDGELGFI